MKSIRLGCCLVAVLTSTLSVSPGLNTALAQSDQTVGGVPPPAKIAHVDPIYPSSALERNISGMVVARVEVGADGVVQEAKIVRGPHPTLINATRAALQQWRFEPMQIRGEPTPFAVEVVVVFQLASNPSLSSEVLNAALTRLAAPMPPAAFRETLVVRGR